MNGISIDRLKPSECASASENWPVRDTAVAQQEPLAALIVEDSEDDAILAADALRSGGFDPFYRRIETAAEMREALAEKSWDVILADHKLPEFSALEAFAIYRQSGLDIPFLIVSGVIGEEVAVAAMKAGVHDYLRKGRLARLAPAVRRELREAEIRRERAGVEAALHSTYSELAAIHANAPVALLVVDQELRVTRVNELAARLAGRPAADVAGLRYGGAIGCVHAHSDSRGCGYGPACRECPVRLAVSEILRGRAPSRKLEAPVRVSIEGRNEERWLLVSCGRIDNGPRPTVLVCTQDITELKQAQLSLQQQRDALELQAHLINLSPDAVIVADAARVIRGWNKGAEEVYGWTVAEAVGASIQALLQTRSGGVDFEALLSRNGRWEGELRHTRHDGQSIFTDSRQVLLRDTAGNTVAILEINRDITERRRAEEELKETVRALEAALAEKTVLLKEIHHRVKNNLAVIASLLSMKAANTTSAQARSALQTSEERVHSMALIHEHLYSSAHLDRIDFSDYADGLVRELHSAFIVEPDRVAIEQDLQPIELEIERAVPCALILNELLSNAFKHAFPDGRRGKIMVSFRELPGGLLELAIADDGVGLPAGRLEEERPNSLGLRIVHILTNQLNGSLEQDARGLSSRGVRIAIRFPAHNGQKAAQGSACGAG